MVTIQVGQQGTLRFLPSQAGLDPAQIASVAWQPQGPQNQIKFTPPDQVEGLAAGTTSYKATVTMKTAGEKYSFPFDAQCTPAGPPAPPVMVPVAIDIAVPAP